MLRPFLLALVCIVAAPAVEYYMGTQNGSPIIEIGVTADVGVWEKTEAENAYVLWTNHGYYYITHRNPAFSGMYTFTVYPGVGWELSSPICSTYAMLGGSWVPVSENVTGYGPGVYEYLTSLYDA